MRQLGKVDLSRWYDPWLRLKKSLDPNSVRLSNICTTASYDINRPKENRVWESSYVLIYSVRPWIGYRYPAFVLFAFEKDCIGARALSRMHPPIPAMLCIYRPVYPPIDPRSPGLKPSGENIVSDLASPPATTSLLLAMISYSTSREREGEEEKRGGGGG